MPRPLTEEEFAEKFWAKVDKVSDSSGCWLWTASKSGGGYGQAFYKGKNQVAHRVSYIISGNTIPSGLMLRHSGNCKGKRICVNPTHLTPGTAEDNRNDMIRDGTSIRGENNPKQKLTEAQVLEIRAITGKLQKEIADIYGISQFTISQIINRVTWKHI